MKLVMTAIALFSGLFAVVVVSQTGDNPHGKLQWDCQDCHTSESWKLLREPMAFNHAETGFLLEGAHGAVPCIACHKEPVFSHVGVSCADCHTDHHQGQLGLACQNCHIPRDWQNRQDLLSLHAQRGFPLVGIHAVADCESCHRGHQRQEYAGTPTDCQSCHGSLFAATSNPSHSRAGFSMNCEPCHSAAGGTWDNATYTHPATFPLTGAHALLECMVCHSETFAGTPTDCYDYHSDDYMAAANPNHVQGSFPQTCMVCHSTVAWQPASYDHNATGFPLTGRHLTVACADCHTSGYTGTPTACVACHQDDYDATTDPNHAAANFPTDCQTCHSTSNWSGTTWDHDGLYFPIYSGAHAGKWDNCADCHINPTNFASFECINCHEHNQTDMDNKHSQVNNYQYGSAACYGCHPQGRH